MAMVMVAPFLTQCVYYISNLNNKYRRQLNAQIGNKKVNNLKQSITQRYTIIIKIYCNISCKSVNLKATSYINQTVAMEAWLPSSRF